MRLQRTQFNDAGSRPARGLRGAVLVVALLAVAVAAVGCGGDEPSTSSPGEGSSPAYTDIGPDELAGMLEDKDFVFINTHVPYEGEIEQTDLFLPFDQAAQLAGRLPEDKAAKIVVYCRTDRMSRIAAEEWAAAGYTDLYNLEGGFVAWEDAGYPLLHLDR
jgi:phage shock protein E